MEREGGRGKVREVRKEEREGLFFLIPSKQETG